MDNTNLKNMIMDKGALGCFSKTEDPAFVECMGYGGFDFVIIDMEHGPNSIQSCQNLIRASNVSGLMSIVRTPENNLSIIGEALDVGADGVQVPQVTTAEEVREIIDHARFYPLGSRGMCRYVRGAAYSSADKEQYFNQQNEKLIIIQLEGEEALGNIEDILEVPGYDVVFIGPYDLSQSLGVPGQVTHPMVIDKMQYVVGLCRDQGIAVGTFVDDEKQGKFWKDQGVSYMCYSVDVGIFTQACSNIVHAMT